MENDEIKGIIELSVKCLNYISGLASGAVTYSLVKSVGRDSKLGRLIFGAAGIVSGATVAVKVSNLLNNTNLKALHKWLDSLL